MIMQIDDKIIRFSEGMPGFRNLKRFVMSQVPEERPFAWLNALDSDVRFAVVEAHAWVKDLTLDIDDEVLNSLGSSNPLDYAIYFIVRIIKSDEGTSMRANTKAPLVLNIRTLQAKQVLAFDHPLLVQAETMFLKINS